MACSSACSQGQTRPHTDCLPPSLDVGLPTSHPYACPRPVSSRTHREDTHRGRQTPWGPSANPEQLQDPGLQESPRQGASSERGPALVASLTPEPPSHAAQDSQPQLSPKTRGGGQGSLEVLGLLTPGPPGTHTSSWPQPRPQTRLPCSGRDPGATQRASMGKGSLPAQLQAVTHPCTLRTPPREPGVVLPEATAAPRRAPTHLHQTPPWAVHRHPGKRDQKQASHRGTEADTHQHPRRA